MDLPPIGFDVRTLHSLALEIVRRRKRPGQKNPGPEVLDDVRSNNALGQAVANWIESYPDQWHAIPHRRHPPNARPLARHHRTHRPRLHPRREE
jgi:hypothetical protein